MDKRFSALVACVIMLGLCLFAFTACDLFGKDGVGIEKIEKTGTEGLVDTYTITLTNGETSTFTVTNGRNGTNGSNGGTADPNASTPDEYFRFKLLEDDTYAIYSRYNDMPMRTVIPATYQGKVVSTIGNEGFSGRDMIDELVIPTSVTSIQSRSFGDFERDFVPEIIYLGTLEQWGKVEVGAWRIRNGEIVVHCTDGDAPVLETN